MKVSAVTSRKVTVLSFVAMVCVVMIHSHATGTIEHPAAWCVFMQTLLMRMATNWAVPFFFVVSGFFFAARNLQRSPCCVCGGYGQLLRKKFRTLFIPYVLWALIGTVISMALVMLNNHIMHHGLFERTFMAADGFWGKIDSLFGITRDGPSGNLALWYVRSLLLLFVMSPGFVLVSKIHGTVLFVIGLVLALAVPEVSIKFLSLKLGSVGWFCVGMGASQLALENRRMPNALFVFAGIGWGALVVLGAMEKSWLHWKCWCGGASCAACGFVRSLVLVGIIRSSFAMLGWQVARVFQVDILGVLPTWGHDGLDSRGNVLFGW